MQPGPESTSSSLALAPTRIRGEGAGGRESEHEGACAVQPPGHGGCLGQQGVRTTGRRRHCLEPGAQAVGSGSAGDHSTVSAARHPHTGARGPASWPVGQLVPEAAACATPRPAAACATPRPASHLEDRAVQRMPPPLPGAAACAPPRPAFQLEERAGQRMPQPTPRAVAAVPSIPAWVVDQVRKLILHGHPLCRSHAHRSSFAGIPNKPVKELQAVGQYSGASLASAAALGG